MVLSAAAASAARRRRRRDETPTRRVTPWLALLAVVDLSIWTYVGHSVAFRLAPLNRGTVVALGTGRP